MGRHLLAAFVVVVDTALLVAGHRDDLPPWGAPAYALAAVLLVALRFRFPVAAFAGALVLALLTDSAYVLLLWSAYQAGTEVVSRSGMAVVVGATLGNLVVRLSVHFADPRAVMSVLAVHGVFVALPLIVGLYLAQHRRLVSALDRHNRQLLLQRELLGEQERLRERLRIARDMHDSLGHRLGLVSVQAAALEVSALPAPQRQAVRQLAGAARDAVNELHELVGALRGAEETPSRPLTAEAIGGLVEEFGEAGVAVTLRTHGEPLPLSPAAGQAAYRVVEEGLTNAARHAPGLPVTVEVGWESDALLLTVANPMPDDREVAGAGHGLSGLEERVRPAGGFLDHGLSGDRFRLFAMLPAAVEPAGERVEEQAWDDRLSTAGRLRTAAVGVAAGALMFAFLPASLLLGVAG
ncbi:sensor histidine kinase [Streptosporangium carneum]|uniref:histidine kinase n=1 Tax=Streptosporangium carneum TaxID=47481 RepID=A0A9W6I522_9ACTN|nr:histidine kinase [Streptosporangium carneum]GLK11318.1 hypothetical protein GCM10017600_47250 [Streptosporangium carneum]